MLGSLVSERLKGLSSLLNLFGELADRGFIASATPWFSFRSCSRDSYKRHCLNDVTVGFCPASEIRI